MRVVRALCVMAIFAVAIMEVSCGDTFRPIAIPQNPQPPDPKSRPFRAVSEREWPGKHVCRHQLHAAGSTTASR